MIRKPGDGWKFYNGVIIKLPVELCDAYRLGKYEEAASDGWMISEFGYSMYTIRTTRDYMLRFPGIYIIDGPKPLRTFREYKPLLRKSQIEEIANGLHEIIKEADVLAKQDLDMLVHDLRGLSTTIHHQAINAESLIKRGEYDTALVRIRNIIASQQMLGMRTDALDFISNPIADTENEEIHVYRRVDKVVRIFEPKAAATQKNIFLAGESYLATRGPQVFELIPYTLIDNALKYSPPEGSVEIEVSEDRVRNFIKITVCSLGPKIDMLDTSRIFENHFRGKAAVSLGVPGSGVGLYLIKILLNNHFAGSVNVHQVEDGRTYADNVYFRTTFTVIVPVSS